MKITCAPEVDAAYMYFRKKRAEVTTVSLYEDIAVDTGPNEGICGIEVLIASVDLETLSGLSLAEAIQYQPRSVV